MRIPEPCDGRHPPEWITCVLRGPVATGISLATIFLASGILLAQPAENSNPATPGDPSISMSTQSSTVSDNQSMKEASSFSTPDSSQAQKPSPSSRNLFVLLVLAVLLLAALIIKSRSRGKSGSPPGEPEPTLKPPLPDPNLDTLLAVYRSNGEALPPKDMADLHHRLSDLIFGINRYIVCSHDNADEVVRKFQDHDPATAFYFLVEYRCPGGFILEDIKSSAMRATEIRRALSTPGTTIGQIHHFLYLPEEIDLLDFK